MIKIELVGTLLDLSKCNGSLHKIKHEFLTFNSPLCSFFFLVFRKSGLITSCLSFEDLSSYKVSWSHVAWCKCCPHRRSLNVCHFGIAATELQLWGRGHLQWHDDHTEFHKYLPAGTKVDEGGQTDTETG
jgi:hypothetical protein